MIDNYSDDIKLRTMVQILSQKETTREKLSVGVAAI